MEIDLSKSPYNLSEKDIQWVNQSLKQMTLKEKVGQLFFLQGLVNNQTLQSDIITAISPGGFLFNSGLKSDVIDTYTHATECSKYPLFLGGTTENGVSGIIRGGGVFGSNMLLGATNNPENAYEVGQSIGEEVRTVGTNIVIDPVVDINYNWRCDVTANRSFGNNVDIVSTMSKKYIEGLKEMNIESIPRHFPGHGVDDRTPNLITTVNTFTMEKWNDAYGKIYKDLIDNGVKALLVSCIALPNAVKHFKPDATKEEIKSPANMSPIIIDKLLKESLGFNGLIISDSTLTSSFNSLGKREELLPLLIASGCDMFLFVKDYLEDFISILKGCKSGIITTERLNEAVTKILATKASMGLHKKQGVAPKGVFYDKDKNRFLSAKLADEGITLLKDRENIIPIDSNKHKKVMIIYLGKSEEPIVKTKTLKELLNDRLEHEGFKILERNYSVTTNNIKYMNENIKSFKENVDLVIYVSNIKPSRTRTSSRINYKSILGLDTPWFAREVPTIFVSLGSPYHMYDMPMISTFINCYHGTEEVVYKLVDKLVGKSEFKGISPVVARFNFYGEQEEKDDEE